MAIYGINKEIKDEGVYEIVGISNVPPHITHITYKKATALTLQCE